MDSEQLLAEIREANLTYLMLAQNLIRKDRAEALYRLGLTEEAADLLGMLTTAQLLKIASSNMLLCRFRVDDDLVWNLLTADQPQREEGRQQHHHPAARVHPHGWAVRRIDDGTLNPPAPRFKTPPRAALGVTPQGLLLLELLHGHPQKHPQRVA